MSPRPGRSQKAERGTTARILLAVDFSTPSKDALEAAAALARDLVAQVVLLHVSPPKEELFPKGGSKISRRSASGAASDAARLTSDWAEALRSLGSDVEALDEVGDPPTTILAKARELRCSLIVLASSGKGSLRSLLVGSTTREVVRRSRLPVLVVPGRRPRGPVAQPASRTFVVGADFSPGGAAAFEAAMALARDVKVHLRLVHAVHVPTPVASFPHSDAVLPLDLLDRIEDEAAALLAKLASQGRRGKVGVTAAVHVGDPATALLVEARQVGAPLIVVGSHGQSAAHQFFVGSVAQAVVQLADRPVLVVPDPRGQQSGGWTR